jgi:hypothetical protein
MAAVDTTHVLGNHLTLGNEDELRSITCRLMGRLANAAVTL